MTNKEICFKYRDIETKAIEIAVLNNRYVWIDTNVKVLENGLKVIFSDEAGIVAECFLTWEDLDD